MYFNEINWDPGLKKNKEKPSIKLRFETDCYLCNDSVRNILNTFGKICNNLYVQMYKFDHSYTFNIFIYNTALTWRCCCPTIRNILCCKFQNKYFLFSLFCNSFPDLKPFNPKFLTDPVHWTAKAIVQIYNLFFTECCFSICKFLKIVKLTKRTKVSTIAKKTKTKEKSI